ncbi:MAG: iron-containing redox enzyme family protein [Thermoplasmatales archaeon]|nr:iron-containing redox enzyme family protein [Thermoplasmatales archaeon]MCW6169604.1 iron-containing redox enzyme family protein [Thermoplasmatales archaeon]
MECPVCLEKFDSRDFIAFADHFLVKADDSDSDHVSWLNNNISKAKIGRDDLSKKFNEFYAYTNIKTWIIKRFIEQFRGDRPHPFILMMQYYNPAVLKGYSFEHYFFLKQWVKSCSAIVSMTDLDDVQHYEIGNILSEYYGYENYKPHIELLLEMGETYGIARTRIYNSRPLPKTEKAIKRWSSIAREKSWIEIMAAMHSLELVANSGLRDYGAKYDYFNLEILDSSDVPSEVKAFLMEGYKADVSHSMEALDLINRYADRETTESIQDAFLSSSFVFGQYLEARIERGEIIEDEQH